MLVRLQKYLADRGVGSRRKCEEYIAEGLIQVNGIVTKTLGTKVDTAKDTVAVDPKLRLVSQTYVYIMLNKPAGYVTTVTGKEKPSVMELLKNVRERVFPVGRLDKDSSGLLLFTNDGRLTFELTHPSQEKEKEYEVVVDGDITPAIVRKLESGVMILGEKTLPCKIKRLAKRRFSIVLKEGKNRQIRRMCRKVGLNVLFLKRVRIGKLLLGTLKSGLYRFLTENEIAKARTALPSLRSQNSGDNSRDFPSSH